MKTYALNAILVASISLFGCGKSKTVKNIAPGTVTPAAELPPIAAPSDDTIQWDEVEDAALADINDKTKVNTADEKNTVYLSAGDMKNNGDDVETAKKGALLGLNMLSNGQFIRGVRTLDKLDSVFAVKITDFLGGSAQANAFWKQIEDSSVIKIVSLTARGRNLQAITGKQIPIMHLKVFLETAFLAKNYYAIKGIPTDENLFLQGQGVNVQQLFDDRDDGTYLAGFQVSQIAPGHNRHITRVFGDTSCWITSDIDSLELIDPVFAAKANFSLNPFPIEARSVNKTFDFSAREILCRQPNGLFNMSLFNADGVRADVAPTTVVLNLRASALGLDADIKPRDCLGCHTKYVLSFKDELGKQIKDQPFSAADKQLGALFYKGQTATDLVTGEDNADHSAALNLMGIGQAGDDPVNVGVIDKMRNGTDLKELASFYYLSEAQLRDAIAGSKDAGNEAGQLLDGGVLPFFSLQGSNQVIIDDLNLFRDIQ